MNTETGRWEDSTTAGPIQREGSLAKSFVSQVMTYMASALAITGVVAYWFGTNLELLQLLYTETGMSTLGWIVTFAPLGIVLIMGAAVQRMSSIGLMTLFLVFSITMGMSLSSIFFVYTMGSIATTFFITAGTFGTMAILGYTTSTDLTKMGSILYMGLIGIILAMIVNWFVGSDTMDYIISILGVLIFTGLTAYDMQKIKQIGMSVDHGSEAGSKLALMGAVSLYLDFINLFLFLLRLFGSRD